LKILICIAITSIKINLFKVILAHLGMEVKTMISFKCWMKLMVALFVLSFLFVFGPGCTTYKEAVAAPVKVSPVPTKTTPPVADIKK
jgi:hypothetical protein